MNHSQKIAVVTGANRGLGLGTSRWLAQQGIFVILTSRDEKQAETVVQSLKNEGLPVAYHQLDVTDAESIQRLATYLQEEWGHLEILVNNAGILIDPPTPSASSIFTTPIARIQTTLETNLYGPLRMSQALIPLMKIRNYGRVVNVSSGMGQLQEMGGSYAAYRFSKTALNALTKMLASELEGSNILVNSVCPGWVKTDMGGPNATRSIEEGVDTIAWLATLDDGSASGGFFRERQPIAW